MLRMSDLSRSFAAMTKRSRSLGPEVQAFELRIGA